MQITIDLPMPLSANRLWRSNRGRVHISSEYKLWITQAHALMLTQKRGPIKMLCGPFKSILWVARPKNRRMDIDNKIKCALDYCVKIGLIEDDKFNEGGSYRWVIPEAAPFGCRLTLTSLDQFELV